MYNKQFDGNNINRMLRCRHRRRHLIQLNEFHAEFNVWDCIDT